MNWDGHSCCYGLWAGFILPRSSLVNYFLPMLEGWTFSRELVEFGEWKKERNGNISMWQILISEMGCRIRYWIRLQKFTSRGTKSGARFWLIDARVNIRPKNLVEFEIYFGKDYKVRMNYAFVLGFKENKKKYLNSTILCLINSSNQFVGQIRLITHD